MVPPLSLQRKMVANVSVGVFILVERSLACTCPYQVAVNFRPYVAADLATILSSSSYCYLSKSFNSIK